MTGMLSIIIFSGLLTAIVIDQPFVGVVKVRPDALAEVVADFGSMPGLWVFYLVVSRGSDRTRALQP
jgi:hypothetical protein